jgi:uncharacterized protein
MERNIMWSPWSGPGLEHLHLLQNDEQVVADGLIIGVEEQVPFRVRYEILCDSQWRLRTVHVSLLSSPFQALHLSTDGMGSWITSTGEAISSLDGCQYVDISATPFTNTLPIRRIALKPGESSTLAMAYITVPQLQVTAVEQRYTCLEITPGGGRYRYESIVNGRSGFTAELPVDVDGLVLDYPQLFRRVGSW